MSLDLDPLLPLSPAVFHILVALAGGDLHGYAIMQDVQARSGGKVRLGAWTLYTAGPRMLQQGLIEEVQSKGQNSDERRRCYRLTNFRRPVAAATRARVDAFLN